MIASLGDIVFETSTNKILAFRDATRDGSTRLARHEIAGRGVRHEVMGHDADAGSLTMTLSQDAGVDPATELRRLRIAREEGRALPLILGADYEGDWLITSLSEQWDVVDHRGIITHATAILGLERYEDE